MKPLLTVEEVADFVQVSRHSVWRWIREGKLRAINLGKRSYRIRQEDLEHFLEERTITKGEGE